MQYRDEFTCEGTEGYVTHVLPYRKKESGCRIGQILAEEFGHTVLECPDGQKVYKLEFVAFPIDQWRSFVNKMEGTMIGDPVTYSYIMQAIEDMDKSFINHQSK